jgi:hypothetical protein
MTTFDDGASRSNCGPHSQPNRPRCWRHSAMRCAALATRRTAPEEFRAALTDKPCTTGCWSRSRYRLPISPSPCCRRGVRDDTPFDHVDHQGPWPRRVRRPVPRHRRALAHCATLGQGRGCAPDRSTRAGAPDHAPACSKAQPAPSGRPTPSADATHRTPPSSSPPSSHAAARSHGAPPSPTPTGDAGDSAVRIAHRPAPAPLLWGPLCGEIQPHVHQGMALA